MRIIKESVNKMLIYVFTLLLAVNLPFSAVAGAVADTTQTTTPTTSQPATTYTYDAATGHWNTNKWYYDAATGTYKAVAQPIVGVPPAVTSSSVSPTVITPPTGDVPASNQQAPATTTNNNNLATTNNIGSQATTGNATVAVNTKAADATTGDATSTATILNNVDSTLSIANNQAAASFVTDVMGNVNGDILLQPMILKAVLENGVSTPTSETATITNTNNMTNNVNLGAISGNAGVVGNTTAGNAKSGTANTVANVVNIINSLVAANQSFVGTINIYGNLNGDILIAPDFITQLIASNGGDSNGKSFSAPSTTTITSNNLENIVNNVSLAAASGKAAVMDNTTAGNAISGNANTNVVIFNLSGHAVVASNSLLVFVNVLGKWVGVIVDAPIGSTSAAIGNGVTSDTVVPPNLTIVNNNSNQITNNINLNSLSGNATVAANTLAGNAVSGNATSSANIANIANSQFGLTGWFGVLFINVFGNWEGSFGINTAAGNPINTSASGGSNNRFIEFVPKPSTTSSNITLVSNSGNGKYAVTQTDNQSEPGKVLSGAIGKTGPAKPTGYSTELAFPKTMNVSLMSASIFVTAISAAGIRRFFLMGKPGLLSR